MKRAIVAAGMVLVAAAGHAAPTVSRAPFGIADDGAVEVLTLRNDHGMVMRVSTRGGTILSLAVPDRGGHVADVVLGRPDFAAWDKSSGFNSVIGRYANRLDKGGFTLDGTFYKLDANPATGVAMHGGPKGFGGRLWSAEPVDADGRAGVRLLYTSADGEGGYPGEMHVTMTYTLGNDDVVRIAYEATTTRPTIVNLTNHTYFNLGGFDAGPVNDELLQVFADRFTPTDSRQVPTGEIRSVAGTPFDFRVPQRIGDRVYSVDPQMVLAKGLDHNFVIATDAPKHGGVPVAVRLRDLRTGRQLEVRTTEPAVQVYSGNNLNGAMLGAGGRTLRQGDGIAFETEHFPDSPNHPNFPSTVLRPGEVFRSVTEWAFSTVR